MNKLLKDFIFLKPQKNCKFGKGNDKNLKKNLNGNFGVAKDDHNFEKN